MIGIEQIQSTLCDLIQRGKHFARGRDIVRNICQRLDNFGALALFLEKPGILDASGGLVCKCHGRFKNGLVIYTRLITIQGDESKHAASSDQRDGHPAMNDIGITPIFEAWILLRVLQDHGTDGLLDHMEQWIIRGEHRIGQFVRMWISVSHGQA